MATKILRRDLSLWSGTTDYTTDRTDFTGGTETGLKLGGTVDVLSVYGGGTTRTRASIALAVNTIKQAECTLELAPGEWTIDEDLTLPDNIALKVVRGATLAISSGKTLTLNGGFEAGLYTVFTGAGTASFGARIREVYPQWFGAMGDGVTDDTAEIQEAITSLTNVAGDGTLFVPAGSYLVSSQLTVPQGLIVEGSGFKRGGTAFRNRFFNGDFRLDQYRNFTAVTPAASTYVVDRWEATLSQASKLTFQIKTTSPPTGFANYFEVEVASQTAPGSADFFEISQKIEGLNLSDFELGVAANTQFFTMSFWVKSDITGTYTVAFVNGAANRSYIGTYTISSAATWEYKQVVVPCDTTGTWLRTVGIGMFVIFSLGIGSDFFGTAGAWAAGNFQTTSGATNFVNNTNASKWAVTGVQFERGLGATEFEVRPISTELVNCQRYAWVINPAQSAQNHPYHGLAISTTEAVLGCVHPASMRGAPSVTILGAAANFSLTDFTTTTAATAIAISNGGITGSTITVTVAAGLTQFRPYFLTTNAAAGRILFSTEL